MSTTRIEAHMQRLADLGTRLRALHDADSTTIQAEMESVRTMDLSRETWEEYTDTAEEAWRHFQVRAGELLRAAHQREAAA